MAAGSSYQFGQFELDLRSYELKRDGQPLRLEKIPMELLIFLVEHHWELVARAQIIGFPWRTCGWAVPTSRKGCIRKQ